jgi:ribosomal protein S18 acetylase RimI-like enzyme
VDLALAERLHLNLMRFYGWVGEVSGDAVERGPGTLLAASRSELRFLNGALRERSDEDAAPFIARAREFFAQRGRGFVAYCWPGDPELERAAVAGGLGVVQERYPEMACGAPVPALAGDVRPVEAAADAELYWEICERAYSSLGFPPGLFTEAFDPELLLESKVWACIGFEDGRPLACGSLYLVDDVGFIGWVGAVPEARGRGLAAACTVAATNQAFARGLDLVSLQASAMGAELYPRIGYEWVYDYRLLGWPPD